MGEQEPGAPLFESEVWVALTRADRRAQEHRRSTATPRPADPREAGVGSRNADGVRRDAPTPRGEHPLVGVTAHFHRGDEAFTGQVIAVSSDGSTLRVWCDLDGRLRLTGTVDWRMG